MKVLKSGEENSKVWRTEETCTGKGWDQNGKIPCGALLEVVAQDVKFRVYTDLGGGVETFYGFVCPLCKCFTEMNIKETPQYVQSNASDYKSLKDDSEK